jgi:muramidase (phage lysozyme)
MIAWAEGTSTNPRSDNGYNVQFTGRIFNNGYRDHPRQIIRASGISSSASGRYQFLNTTWDRLAARLGLNSFSPANQDRAAVELLKSRGAYDAVLRQDWPTVIDKIACEWASIPRRNGSFCYRGQGAKTPQEIYDFLAKHLAGANPTLTGGASSSEGGTGPGGFSFIKPLSDFKRPDFFYTCKNEFSKEVIPCRARTFNPKELLDLDSEMRFNILTGRLPYSVDIISKDFSIETQIPIEFIRFLSAQEPYPTETFMNHLDGQFYYTPRVNDVSGLADPKRFYRTYYHRTIPPQVEGDIPKPSFKSIIEKLETEGCEFTQDFDFDRIFGQVDYNQMTINYKEELSSLGMKTNFFIANQSPNGSVAGDAIIMHMSARPAFLRGHEIGGRNLYVIDETIKNIGEAAAVAAAVARLYAKELRSASMTVIGDPSLTPGELVQTVNSPVQLESLQTFVDERQSIVEYEGATRASYLSALEVTRQGIESRADASAPLTGNYSSETSPDGYERVDDKYKMRARKADFKKSADDIFCSATKKETATVVERDNTKKEGEEEQSPRENESSTEEWGENHWRKSGFKQDPRSIWRIEGVRHTLNSAGSQGWTSELVLLSPY